MSDTHHMYLSLAFIDGVRFLLKWFKALFDL